MPEEKKEKKSIFPVPFFASSERKEKEDGKKDSFTFSDKIKNSKPVPSKSFANRISSKIGSDGKPKKTLFERTRRDAPFFIAALVALLLLPFLYKYSGQVSEEPVVLPGSEESIFDPERYGFDTATGDPDGQIEQLAGRDPLSLIKGFGSQDENTADARYDQPVDRSGLSDDDSYNSSTVEENNTNIYKRQAAPATRAAFRRAATKINKLDGAGMTGRSGGKLGVGMWGGNLKSAAKKVGSSAPRTSPKPVSLQPLQAAGKPSRSYFGQGAAAEARRSKDAMSKANAMQALRDAAMKPVEPGKIGGLGGGAFGPGGGNGKLDRHFAWNGKEPWWWDMMKKRSQMEWEKKFNYKWGWIDWATKLGQNIAAGILNCLLTGTDDGGMGKMLGATKGAGKEPTCCGLKESEWDGSWGKFGKDSCKKYKAQAKTNKMFKCDGGWKDGNQASEDLNFFQVRWDCLTEGFGAKSKKRSEKGEVDSDCEGLKTSGVYTASYSSQKGEDRKYFSYVVGIPTNKLVAYYKMQPTEQRKQWVVGAVVPGTTLNLNLLKDRANFVPLFVESVAVKPKKVNNDGSKVETKKDAESVLTDASTKKDQNAKLTYDALIATLADGGVFYDTRNDIAADSDTATKGTAKFDLKGGKKGKDWIVGGRCQVPFARVTCENTALTGPKGTEIYPFAHIQFANGVVDNKAIYKTLAPKFKIVYKVLQGDNYGKTLENDHATGVYTIQHNTIKPYTESWFEGSEANGGSERGGWVTRNRPAKNTGNTYQVIAAGEKALVKENGNRDASRVIKWEIYQCDNADIAGDDLADGGCDKGLWPQFDKDGKMIGEAGQQLPGVVLSTAVCEYGRSGDDEGTAPGVPPVREDIGGDNPNGGDTPGGDNPNGGGTPGGDRPNDNLNPGDQPGNTVRLAPRVIWVPSEYTMRTVVKKGEEPQKSNFPGDSAITGGRDSSPVKKQHCGDGMGAEGVRDFQVEVKNYVNSVVDLYNQKVGATAPQMEKVSAEYVKLGELIDALNIAKSIDANAQVSKNVVIALARTMTGASRDPHDPANGNTTWTDENGQKRYFYNELGAFLAYVHEEAAFYPFDWYEENRNCDYRFNAGETKNGHCARLWRKVAIKIYGGEAEDSRYNHSNYVWLGNGRTPSIRHYKQSLGANWSYPLKDLAPADTPKISDCKLSGCAEQRRTYGKAIKPLLSGEAGLAGNMAVKDAFSYVNLACTNGLDKKPHGVTGGRMGGRTNGSGTSPSLN